jgi:Tfp pilus assembly protein PilO
MINKGLDKEITKANYFLNTNYKYISIALVMIVFGVGIWLVIWPKFSDIQHENNNRVPELRQERDNKALYYQKLQQLDESFSDLTNSSNQRELDKVNNILPNKANVQSLFVEIERMVTETGFILKQISLNEVKTDIENLIEFQVAEFMNIEDLPAELRAVDIEITVEGGGYNEFKSLLKRIEDNVRLFNLVTVNFSALSDPSYVGSDGEEIAAKEYSFDFRTYYLDQEDAS